MATGGASLEDVFEEHLSCHICYEQYIDPKFLDCHHTFCRPCIERYYQKNYQGMASFPCPTCRRGCKLPQTKNGFHDLVSNFYINGMKSDFERINSVTQTLSKSKPPCDPCKRDAEDVMSENNFLELECEDFLCQPCTTTHRRSKATGDHNIFTIGEMHSEEYEQVMPALQSPYCKTHQGEPLELYCTTCKTFICVKCKVLVHEKHGPMPIEKLTKETKQEDSHSAVGLVKSEKNINTDNIEETNEELNRMIRFLCQISDDIGESTYDDVEVMPKQDKKQLDALQSTQSLEFGSMSNSITLSKPLREGRKPAKISDMSKQCITRTQQLLKSTPNPLPVLQIPCIGCYWSSEAVVQSRVGPILCKLKQFNIDLHNSDPIEVVSYLSTTPKGDIVVGTWSKDEWKRHIYVYSSDGKKKNTFPVPGLRGLVAIPDGRIATTVCTDTKEKVCLLTLAGEVSQSIYCAMPRTIAVDSQGHLIVLTRDQVVHLFNSGGKQIREFDQQKTKAQKKYYKYIGVNHAHNDDIIVSDINDHCLYVYNSSGGLQLTFGSKGDGDGQLNRPFGVCCNSDGDIIVTDLKNHRIHLVTSTGQFKCFLLTKEDGIKSPGVVALLSDGFLMIGEQNGTIKIYKYK